jgi:type IV secretory pathway VirB4 component
MPANAANTQELVDIASIRDGTIVMANGSLLQIIMVGGMNFALKSESEQNVIVSAYQNFLNSLDFPLQIIVHSRKINIEKYLTGLESRKDVEPSGLLRSQIGEYQEFIRNFVSQFAIMRKIFLVMVPFYPLDVPSAKGIVSKLPFMQKQSPKAAAAEDETTMREHIGQLKQRVDQVVGGLRPVGLEVTVLTDEQLVELFYNFYNPETIEREAMNIPPRDGAAPAHTPPTDDTNAKTTPSGTL